MLTQFGTKPIQGRSSYIRIPEGSHGPEEVEYAHWCVDCEDHHEDPEQDCPHLIATAVTCASAWDLA